MTRVHVCDLGTTEAAELGSMYSTVRQQGVALSEVADRLALLRRLCDQVVEQCLNPHPPKPDSLTLCNVIEVIEEARARMPARRPRRSR